MSKQTCLTIYTRASLDAGDAENVEYLLKLNPRSIILPTYIQKSPSPRTISSAFSSLSGRAHKSTRERLENVGKDSSWNSTKFKYPFRNHKEHITYDKAYCIVYFRLTTHYAKRHQEN